MLCSAVQSCLVGVTNIVRGRGDEEGLEVPSRLSVLIGYAQWPIAHAAKPLSMTKVQFLDLAWSRLADIEKIHCEGIGEIRFHRFRSKADRRHV